MTELITTYVDRYAVWGMLALCLLAVVVLLSIRRQLRRLNGSLSSVTAGIQEYFQVILEDQEEAPGRMDIQETRSASVRDNREISPAREEASGKKEYSAQEEAVFQTVIQEYFS